MTEFQMISAENAKTQSAVSRMEIIKEAVLHSAQKEGQNNTYVSFRAKGDEIVELMKLGYEVRVSESGTTHISWFE